METFIKGGFHIATIVVIVVVGFLSLLPVMPFLLKKLYQKARHYFLIIFAPTCIILVSPMVAIIFDKAYAQVGWVFYFFLFPVAVVYYLIMSVYCLKRYKSYKESK
ncbi:hypothetical protein [Candidatus Uabimicrobium sp. HlEnr_7]|uniref:hypothetical protein n=1 Tax=Candidatus Uabimicrobium helgolandensis TaxID=3095367 RepID=UPI0035568C42